MTWEVTFTNPLGRTLAHYEKELIETFVRCGISHSKLPSRLVEGGKGLFGKASMLRNALLNIASNRHSAHPNIQLWPSLGLLEPRLWGSKTVRNIVLLHDPIPLRRQVGFDQLSRSWAARGPKFAAPVVMVHSEDALRAAKSLLPAYKFVKALHPICSSQASAAKTNEPTVLVAGQYKPERNLEMLSQIGPLLRAQGVTAEIHGRGWPSDLPGWNVSNRFVAEKDLDALLARAWVVLLPYDLYFQSGIAIRALEQGTLTVTPRTSFAEDLLGIDSRSIISSKNSTSATMQAILDTLKGDADPAGVFEAYRARVDASWRAIPYL